MGNVVPCDAGQGKERMETRLSHFHWVLIPLHMVFGLYIFVESINGPSSPALGWAFFDLKDCRGGFLNVNDS